MRAFIQWYLRFFSIGFMNLMKSLTISGIIREPRVGSRCNSKMAIERVTKHKLAI